MPIPTATEINVHNSLDEQRACRHYLGKTLEEAEKLHHDGVLAYQDDLMWMGPVAFRYYVRAFIRFLHSEAATNCPDAINGFAGTLEIRLEYEPGELAPIARELADACTYILEHWNKFDPDPDIYGNLDARYTTLKQAFTNLQNDEPLKSE